MGGMQAPLRTTLWLPAVVAASLAIALPGAAQEEQPTDRGFPYLIPAGDLDGDGGPDVVSVERQWVGVSEVGRLSALPTLTARRGADGAVLWEREEGAFQVHPTALGPEGKPGVLLVRGNWTRSESGGSFIFHRVEANYVDLLALGGDGSNLWRFTTDSGIVAGAGYVDETDGNQQASVWERYPTLAGTISATESPATDALVLFLTRRETPDHIESTLDISVVDGADGQIAWSRTVQTVDTRPSVQPAGDLDGDGLEDFVVLREPTFGGVTARRGTDGAKLWTNQGSIVPYSVGPVDDLGDVTGDGIDDLAVRGTGGSPADTTPRISVLDGRTGELLFAEVGSTITAVGALNDEEPRPSAFVTQRYVSTPERAVLYRLLDPEGAFLAERVIEEPAEPDTYIAWLPPAGDLDDDGVAEVGHILRSISAVEGTTERVRIVSGRTLISIFDGIALPLGRSLDGSGHDLVTVLRPSAGTWSVTARDGASGATLWSGGLAADAGYPRPDDIHVAASDVDGDGVADVVLDTRSSRAVQRATGPGRESIGHSWVLSGIDGRVLWET